MKKILFTLLTGSVLLASCNGGNDKQEISKQVETTKQESQPAYYGQKIDESNAVDAAKLSAMMEGKDSVNVKLAGTINEVCQVKGCWMTMTIGDEEMRVSFKDYAFFVPKDANGKSVVIEGVAFRDTTSVETLKHYAEDAGDSAEEIEAITEPEISISFEASGVIIR